ncbi:MAG: LEA type 2 family protein [Methylophagaceae bacterium]
MKKIFVLLLLSLSLISCSDIVKELVSAPEVKGIRLADFSIAEKRVVFDVDLYNPNPFTLPMSGFSGDFKLNNLSIGSVEASSEQKLVAHGTQTISLPISLDTNALIEAAKSVFTERQANYNFNGGIDTSVGNIPFSKSGELSAQDIISQLISR